MLTAEKVLPEEIAGSKEPRQQWKSFLVAQEREGFFPRPAFRVLHRQIEKLIKSLQSLGGVRSPGEGMGKLLDQDGGQTQLLLFGRVRELLTIAVADRKVVMQLAGFQIDTGL